MTRIRWYFIGLLVVLLVLSAFGVLQLRKETGVLGEPPRLIDPDDFVTAPSDVTVRQQGGGLLISWTPAERNAVQYFVVRRSPYAEYYPVGNVSAVSCTARCSFWYNESDPTIELAVVAKGVNHGGLFNIALSSFVSVRGQSTT